MKAPARNITQTDIQRMCDHLMGATVKPDLGVVLVHQDDADIFDKLGGMEWFFCPLCGVQFEEVHHDVAQVHQLQQGHADGLAG